MEIELTLESGSVCYFTPDFRVQTNTSDQTKVSWRLSNRKFTPNMGVLPPELSDEITIYPTPPGGSDV
jgi:hypothetical protein